MTTRLLIARHGNTFGPDDVVTRVGKTDLPLVDSGLEQGRQLGRYLAQENMQPDVIFTSSLRRTQQTAQKAQEAMGTQIAYQPLDIFDEIDYGPDENRPEEDVVARLGKAAIEAWDRDAQVPHGWHVDPAAIIANWKKFADDLLAGHAEQTVLVVTSNGIARFAPYLTGDFRAFLQQHKIKVSTGALGIFEHNAVEKNWVCKGWNIKPKDFVS